MLKYRISFKLSVFILLTILIIGAIAISVLTYSANSGINYNAMVAYGTILLAFATGAAMLWAIYDRIGLKAREHYEVLKENCLIGIDRELRSRYLSTFAISDLEHNYNYASNKAMSYYFDKVTTNKPKYPRKYKFSFTYPGSNVDGYYYEDIPNHFYGLKDKLNLAEKFINKYTEQMKTYEKDLFDTISSDAEFKNFISQEVERIKIGEQQITTDCLAFIINSIFTRDKVLAASYTGTIQNYQDGVETCYKIAMKHKNYSAVKRLKSIEANAKQTLSGPLAELDLLLKRTVLQGTCPYIK